MSASGWTLKEGVVMREANTHPHMLLILKAAVATAPKFRGPNLVVVTEAWRRARHPDDAHEWCNAFDLRTRAIMLEAGQTEEQAGWEWVARMRDHLGGDVRYQFDVHGPTLHIHAEFDPRRKEFTGQVFRIAA